MTDEAPQLQMVFPKERLSTPPEVIIPAGYSMRQYRPGDEPAFYHLMALAGWPGWNDIELSPRLRRILPRGWFMIFEDKTDTLVASTMCFHSHVPRLFPFGGEIAWVCAHPEHAGHGLGRAVVAAATARLIEIGYTNIHLYTEHYRPAALWIYLTMGWVPFMYRPEMPNMWKAICDEVGWPYTPEKWHHR